MQVTEFVRTYTRNFRVINLGNGAKDKLNLFGIAVLQSIPKRSVRLKDGIENIIDTVFRGVVVEIDEIKYALVDRESFEIINDSESFISLWLKPTKGEVLLDIGAHIGKYALKTAKVVGDAGMVLAIEANPVNYQVLGKNLKLNNIENVIALNLAAWNQDCTLKLFVGHLGGHHSVKINWNLGSYKVRARALDDVIKEYEINNVDWIKIDVEGAEWEALCGLTKTIEEHKAKIIVELSYENLDMVKKFLKLHEYSIIKISPLFEGVVYGTFRKYAYFLLLPV
jgi:FkbM family methyltransferase